MNPFQIAGSGRADGLAAAQRFVATAIFLALPETRPASELVEGHTFSADLALTVGKSLG